MNKRLITQTKQRFASEVLWHFVGYNKSEDEQYKTLLSILKDGLRKDESSKGTEFKFVDNRTKKPVTLYGYPVVCLADIPFKDLHIHAERYGRFAIGFHKESVICNRFNPVLYVNQHSNLFHRFIELELEIIAYLERTNKEVANKFHELLLYLGSLAKSGDLKANPENRIDWDDLQINNFYYEREWRSIYDWNFKNEDIAAIIIPDHRIRDFIKDMKSHSLIIGEVTPIIPFSMIYTL
jgi:hypothetical protein